ncbi:MAG: glycosyltransferase, partial [Maribacter sp.]
MVLRFLLYITYPYSIPICKPLEKELLKRGMEVKWFVEDKNTKLKFTHGEVILPIQEAVAYSPHVVLTATDYVADFIPGIKVQLFHGFPANKRKGIDQFVIRNFFDLYCTQGPTSTEIFQAKSAKMNHFEVVETGWSKMDSLFPLTPRNRNGKPHILVSSTFTKKYSLALNDEVVTELGRLSELGKWHFDVVLHPILDPEIGAKFKTLQNGNLTYHDTTDLVPLFKKSDVMLCDTSSALIEYLLQIKPVVTFRNNMPLPSYINITEVSNIESGIAYALTEPPELLERIREYAMASHPYTDGKSAERVIDAALLFLAKDKSRLKPKPIDLIRKYKIRKKLGYWTLKSFRNPITIPTAIQFLSPKALQSKDPENLNKISAVLITFNEILHIDAVLENVAFADEIIVVDSFSTDGTLQQIKNNARVKLIQRPFLNYTDQKSFAMSQATNDWVLFMDADERLTEPLKIEILNTVNADTPADAYFFYRTFMFNDSILRFSGWQSDKNFRLFRKSKVSFSTNRIVHETLNVDGEIGVLKHKLIHYSYNDYDDYKGKMIKYGQMKASEELEKNYDPNLYHFIFRPFYKFFNHYILRLGILDGKKGLIICYLNALG